MSPALTCIAMAFVGGVDLGYQPAANGGLELIVQIDPNTFQSLRENDPIKLDVPRKAQQFPSRQITVSLGNSRLPRTPPQASPPPTFAPPGSPVFTSPPPFGAAAPARAE